MLPENDSHEYSDGALPREGQGLRPRIPHTHCDPPKKLNTLKRGTPPFSPGGTGPGGPRLQAPGVQNRENTARPARGSGEASKNAVLDLEGFGGHGPPPSPDCQTRSPWKPSEAPGGRPSGGERETLTGSSLGGSLRWRQGAGYNIGKPFNGLPKAKDNGEPSLIMQPPSHLLGVVGGAIYALELQQQRKGRPTP